MQIPNPYFENVPMYGNLIMEQIIVEYVYPLLSVLKDNSGNRYLCMCFDTRGSQQWIVAPISTSVLIKLLTNKVTLDYPFKKSNNHIILAIRNYEKRSDSFSLLTPSNITAECLPKPGEYLDAEPDEWEAYIDKINVIESSWIEDSTVTEVFYVNTRSASIVLPVRKLRAFHQETTDVIRYNCSAKVTNMRYAVAY